jgi:hypothetical protein
LEQASGWRACALEKPWRVWQGLQDPSEPSGLMRPIPEFGQLRRVSLLGLDGSIWTLVPWQLSQPMTATGSPAVT